MKKRIQMDVNFLFVLVALTGVMCFFPGLYPRSLFLENSLDFLGYLLVIKGMIMRMAARGHKKAFSKKSNVMVSTGPYALVRNPMYLGTFLICCGFMAVLSPWWVLLIFPCFFYMRFKREVEKEEKWLGETFGKSYKDYCQRVPRLFPSFKALQRAPMTEIFNFEEAISTKERRGLLVWPLLAFILGIFQQHLVYGQGNLVGHAALFVMAVVFFSVSFIAMVWRSSGI